ncbi:MAG: PadR family transcriptional regulator [bacterium]|nr:PadR family transcriptional regulator [bacterium]
MKVLTKQEEQILLAIYHLKDNAYLVPIREQIKEYTGKYYSVGTIYSPLNRLRKSGHLDTYLGEPNPIRGGKAIKYYKLTKMGFTVLSDAKKMVDMMWDGYSDPVYEK